MRRQMHVADNEYLAVSEGRIRIRIGAAIFVFALVVAIVRLAEISLLTDSNGSRFYKNTNAQYRADIVDRNGELLAKKSRRFTIE